MIITPASDNDFILFDGCEMLTDGKIVYQNTGYALPVLALLGAVIDAVKEWNSPLTEEAWE